MTTTTDTDKTLPEKVEWHEVEHSLIEFIGALRSEEFEDVNPMEMAPKDGPNNREGLNKFMLHNCVVELPVGTLTITDFEENRKSGDELPQFRNIHFTLTQENEKIEFTCADNFDSWSIKRNNEELGNNERFQMADLLKATLDFLKQDWISKLNQKKLEKQQRDEQSAQEAIIKLRSGLAAVLAKRRDYKPPTEGAEPEAE